MPFHFESVFGVDFSGAKDAGRNLWVARTEPISRRVKGRSSDGSRLRLTDLSSLESLCGTAARSEALAHLVQLVRGSSGALWSMDFPFGLPLEVLEPDTHWPAHLDLFDGWGEDAYGFGVACVRLSQKRLGRMHVRRLTDQECKAPFDCYHYRIIYQTYFGMRDVLGPLLRSRGTAILPFQYRRLPSARRVLVETCPSSTLKRLGLPHQNYKQPTGGPLTPKRRRVRRSILDSLSAWVDIGDRHRRVIMRNGGGDALDAVIAAVGGAQAWAAADHRLIARHPRYPREGRLYA